MSSGAGRVARSPRVLWYVDPEAETLRAHGGALRRLDYPVARLAAGRKHRRRRIRFPKPPARPYARFLWALRNCDIVVLSPDRSLLRETPLAYHELQLLRKARRKVVVLPHGSGGSPAEPRARPAVQARALDRAAGVRARGRRAPARSRVRPRERGRDRVGRRLGRLDAVVGPPQRAALRRRRRRVEARRVRAARGRAGRAPRSRRRAARHRVPRPRVRRRRRRSAHRRRAERGRAAAADRGGGRRSRSSSSAAGTARWRSRR